MTVKNELRAARERVRHLEEAERLDRMLTATRGETRAALSISEKTGPGRAWIVLTHSNGRTQEDLELADHERAKFEALVRSILIKRQEQELLDAGLEPCRS
jgi:hypothetical protein